MIEAAGLVSITGVAGIIGLAAGIVASAVGTKKLLLADSFAPGARCRRVEQLALLPWAGAMLGVTALLLPALLKLAGLIDDHCLTHGLHHPHFCLRHLPTIAPGPVMTIVLLSGAIPVFGLIRVAFAGVREARLLAGIKRMAWSTHSVIRTELDAPRAFLFGLRRPRIVLSAGLLRLLTPAERRAVVRHEIAHARAGDPARRFILGFLLAVHLPQSRKRLQRHWNQAAEERADDCVADRGQGLELASALVRVLRTRHAAPMPAAHPLAIDSADVARRIRRLVDEARDIHVSPRLEYVFAAAVLFVVVTIASGHHTTETITGWIIGG
ncbi:MAG: M56 family metallopeptidase [Wenzhouxiangellaceae bacterium]